MPKRVGANRELFLPGFFGRRVWYSITVFTFLGGGVWRLVMQDANRLGLLWGPWDMISFLLVVYFPAFLAASVLAGLFIITKGHSDSRLAPSIFLLWPIMIF